MEIIVVRKSGIFISVLKLLIKLFHTVFKSLRKKTYETIDIFRVSYNKLANFGFSDALVWNIHFFLANRNYWRQLRKYKFLNVGTHLENDRCFSDRPMFFRKTDIFPKQTTKSKFKANFCTSSVA